MCILKRTLLILAIIVHTIMQTNGIDKYTDENRPYEFGFNIDGEQHRHEKKDENGIIMGEFGFITADGVYHVTVYATDEQGRFKILSMKNIRVKPYPTAPTHSSRTGHSLSLPASKKNMPLSNPTKEDSQTTYDFRNNQQRSEVPKSQLPPRQPASPVKSCSHCSLPTTTTHAPLLPKVFGMQTNQDNTELSDPLIENHNINENNQNNQKLYNQGNVANLARSDDIPLITEHNNRKPEQGISGNTGLDNIEQNNYANVQINDRFNNDENIQQKSRPEFGIRNIPEMDNTFTYVTPNYNNNGPNENGQKNPQLNSKTYNNNQYEDTSLGFGFTGSDQNSPQINESHLHTENTRYDNNQSNVLGNRSPKKYEPSSGFSPYNTNIDVTSSNASPKKPMLISAQMQVVDKNTDIYHKNPGERDGLPEGVTKDYMERVLYVFNYTVGFHGHYEKGYENGAKQGYYYVTGRNGVRTRVDYEADEKGFRPKISQVVLDILSEEVPKPETEKEQRYGLKSYEFKWLYFPEESQQQH